MKVKQSKNLQGICLVHIKMDEIIRPCSIAEIKHTSIIGLKKII